MATSRAMKAPLAGLLLWSAAVAAAPGDVRDFPALSGAAKPMLIYSSTDTAAVAAVIADYQQLDPAAALRYHELSTRGVYERFLADRETEHAPDLLISTGMDLQVKLVNDGYALRHVSEQTAALPDWACWRNEVFGLSYEPAVIVYDPRVLAPAAVPRTRFDLLRLLQDPRAPLRGKVGSYDITRSGVGYLLATQDARHSSLAGALVAALGANDVVLEDETGKLLDRLTAGELTLGYNLLGSYAQARINAGSRLRLLLPEDYTLVVSRTALIPKSAAQAAAAQRFLDYLLSERGQRAMAGVGLLPIRPELREPLASERAVFRPVPLGPGLLVYLDSLKSRQFLEAWLGSVRPAAGSDTASD
jgi:iron(III) transport system substrate-binding protein